MGEVARLPAVSVREPEPLNAQHQVAGFRSREPALDEWLRRSAARNEERGFSRTFVVATTADEVVGFYALANGAVQRGQVPKRLQRNAPDPIPVLVLGRLAVAEAWEGRGIGAGLLKDAIQRTLAVGRIAGVGALLVHAKSEEAAGFYHKYGFNPSPLHELILMLGWRELEAMHASEG